MTGINTEAIFDHSIGDITSCLYDINSCDLVVGIPFFNESKENLEALITSVDRVMESWIGRRQLIICVGDASAGSLLEVINRTELKHPCTAFLLPPEISGRGTSIRVMIEISKRLEADLLVFSANMAGDRGPGIEAMWLESLLTPIQGNYDLVLGSLSRYAPIDSIGHMLAAPVLEAFYGCRINDPLGGIYALSHDLVEELAHETRFWGDSIQGYGIDFWLITRALCWSKNICEVNIGEMVIPHTLEERNRIFYETALIIFECIKRDSVIWMQERLIIKINDILARSGIKQADLTEYPVDYLLNNLKQAFNRHQRIFNLCVAEEEAQRLINQEAGEFSLPDELWVSSLLALLLLYTFEETEIAQDIFAVFTGLYNGKIASYIVEMRGFEQKLSHLAKEERQELMVHKMEAICQRLTEQFWQQKPEFIRRWLQRSEQQKPAIVPLGYMEYVPGKPVVMLKKIAGKDRRMVATDSIFKDLRAQYEEKFNGFISEGLGLSGKPSPAEMIAGVENFIGQLEESLEDLLPGGIYRKETLEQFVGAIFDLFTPHEMFTIHSELLREMLIRFPPVNLMIPMGYYKAADFMEHIDPRDAITYANLAENWSDTDRDLLWLLDNLKPESFDVVEVKPVILSGDLSLGIMSQGKVSNLNRVTARIAVRPLEANKGGKYPRLRFFLALIRRLAIAENYSRLFRLNVCERKNIGLKMRNSLLGLRGGDEFSAYNIFENFNHRILVKKLRELAQRLEAEGNSHYARLWKLAAESYGLSQVLENGTFLTCTAWSWSSYSFKGGLKIPTPLTTSVESRWFNHDFLESLYDALGYDPAEIEQIVFHLIQNGKSNHNLLDTLLPARPRDIALVVQEITNEPSHHLQRIESNPILEPLEASRWESHYVLNPGAIRIGDRVYLFYRAVGEDGISRIGLAITDGYRVIERLPQPIFEPANEEEKMGCEDPRLIIIDQKIFMLYTAYNGNIAQIAAASMHLDDFLAGKYHAWRREGLAFKNIWDKDAILFPEKINQHYVIYHRIEPSIWVTYLKELTFPIREKHAIIVGPRPGRMWDSLKIGAGAQPLKTRYGWLLIYHGVDYNYIYRLGVILVDLNNPQKVLYRSPNPILEPQEDYEIGCSGSWVPNVVFTCGAVAGTDKEVLDDDDEILVYYGAADTSIGVARATLSDLIPPAFRVNV